LIGEYVLYTKEQKVILHKKLTDVRAIILIIIVYAKLWICLAHALVNLVQLKILDAWVNWIDVGLIVAANYKGTQGLSNIFYPR